MGRRRKSKSKSNSKSSSGWSMNSLMSPLKYLRSFTTGTRPKPDPDLKLYYGEGTDDVIHLFDKELKHCFKHDAASEKIRKSVLRRCRRLRSSDVSRRLASCRDTSILPRIMSAA